jgi:hypothetical protein
VDYPSENRVTLTFEKIEALIGDKLPASARRHLNWWANDATSHVQSQQWLAAGWRVFSVNLSAETVIFERNTKMERAYNAFFRAFYADLQPQVPFAARRPLAGGSSWYAATAEPDKPPHSAFWTCSFFEHKQFRVELYIDSLDKARNKRVFHALYRDKEAIEAELGVSLYWQLDAERRPSRLGIRRPGSVEASPEEQAALRAWGIHQLLRFYEVTHPRVHAALSEEARGVPAPEVRSVGGGEWDDTTGAG